MVLVGIMYLKGILDISKREQTESFLSFLMQLNSEKNEVVKQGITSFPAERVGLIEKKYTELLLGWKSKYEDASAKVKNKKVSQ